jgi:poly(3-hydroxybutyrate) depolymerase
VRPQDIRQSALLTVEGELDDISGAGQTRAAHDLCLGIPEDRRFHYDVPGAGHYGIFSGRRWRDLVYPRVRDFIRSHVEAHQPEKPAVEGNPAAAARASRARSRRA